MLAGLACADAAAAADRDLYGDPLPDGAVARLGTVRFRGPDGSVIGLRFSADGQTLLTVSDDATLRLWETTTGRMEREVRPDPLYVRTVAFSPDGKLMALNGSQRTDGDVPGFQHVRRLVDTASGKVVGRLSLSDRDSDHDLAFTPDGKFLMSLGSSGILRIEEIASGVELLQQKFTRDNLASLAVSPDGKTVAVWSGPNTRKLYLWNWQSGEEPQEVKLPRQRIRTVAFSCDGKTLAACGDFEPFVDEWDVATGRLRNHFELREDVTPGGLAFHPDGETIAVSDSGNQREKHWSGGVLLLERGTGKLVREMPTPGTSAHRVVFSSDGHWLAAVSGGGVHVWDLGRGEEVAAGAAGHQGGIGQIATAHGGLIATASDDHTVRVWDAATGKERLRLPHGHWVRALALSSDGRRLVSSSLDDFVYLWDLQSGNQVYKLPGHGELGGYRAVGFTPDGGRFLSWGDDLYLRVWDVTTGKALLEIAVRPSGVAAANEDDEAGPRERRMMGMLMGPAAFTPDGKRLVAALGGTFHVIDTATGRMEHSVKHLGSNVISSLAVAPDGRLFASSGWGRSIQTKLPDGRTQSTTPNHHPVCLIELASGKLARELELPTSEAGPVTFSPDGKLLAIGFGRGGGEVRLLNLGTQETVAVLADFGSGPHAITFSPDGKYLVTGLNDQTALVWDMAHVLAKKTKKEER
jgi:WD40 repeat protein